MSRVREFHLAFGQPAPSYPTVPDAELAAFRMRLITEEYKEVQEASAHLLIALRSGAKPSAITTLLQAFVKEVCDLRYVAEGALVACGVEPDAYDEVHRSNMSKLGEDSRPVTRPDGKALKGPNYTPPDPNKLFPSIIEGTVVEEDIVKQASGG